MCGISGYIGHRDAIDIAITILQGQEYRGYDSAGLAAIVDGKLCKKKEVGKVAVLKESLELEKWQSQISIAHTRWATHGKPSLANAHPHHDHTHQCLLVHNGIIENYEVLQKELISLGISFNSQTDTEVISQLVGVCYQGNLLEAVQKAVSRLEGAFAIAVMHAAHPDEIILATKESPLCVGRGQQEMFIASDPGAFVRYTRDVVYLHSCELARVTKQGLEVFCTQLKPKQKTIQTLGLEASDVSKGQYPHYMLKEIYEQERSVKHAMLSHCDDAQGSALFEELDLDHLNIERSIILACGTSYHAGLVAAQMLEEWTRLPVRVEVASEFRYRPSIVEPNTLVIAISQSGETADTLAALRALKHKCCYSIGLCNVQNSTLTREVDASVFLRAGPEIGVASTKAFTNQLVLLSLFALKLARLRGMSVQEGQSILRDIQGLPEQVKQVLLQRSHIQDIAKRYACYHNFFYLGRRYMFPAALEGALKLKEIAYINANGYAAGEMKHGPIALIHPDCPTVACMQDLVTLPK